MELSNWKGLGTLVAQSRCADGVSSILLVQKDREWVTGCLARDENREWLWGHYFPTRGEAEKDFGARVARGY